MLVALVACKERDEFQEAISKHRHSLVDQVNPAGVGVPYYTIETLNPVWKVSDKTPLISIPPLRLTDQNGKLRDQSMFEGKISIVGFIFTSCSGFCPFLVEGMKSIEKEVSSLGKDVQFVGLSVDPENDSPQRLQAYAEQKKLDGDRWLLLTGDKDAIYSLARKTFASQVFRRKSPTPSFVHSEHLYVIDQKGYLRGILNGTRVDVKKDARNLLSQLATASDRPTN